MNKAQKITSICFGIFFALLGIVLLFWYFGDSYPTFYANAEKEFEVAGLEDGFTPQGLCYEENSKTFLSSGYMKDGSASRIYVIDGEEGKTTKYFTLNNGEEDYSGHAGGIATDGTNVWIVGDGYLFRFMFADIELVENGDSIDIIDGFKTGNGADFITVEENFLWVGEFHKDGKYDTDESHHIETENSTNKAIHFCYEINSANEYGIKSTTPVKALSTGSLVQGMEITTNKIILSTSYSLPNSHIYIYENIFTTAEETFDYNGTPIDLYVLEEVNLLEDIEAPCMSEELAIADGRVYVLFESACKKYGMVTREALKHVYSLDIEI
ncbi:MAG: hypothetical protein E7375_02490 [Clostridiales bacterium]|nr:hypothetical protein [Clostridiales bacterium]